MDEGYLLVVFKEQLKLLSKGFTVGAVGRHGGCVQNIPTYIYNKKILSVKLFCFFPVLCMNEECSTEGRTGEECSLCFEPLKDATTCSHCKQRSCEACIDRWTMVQIQQKVMPSCPYCRFELLESFGSIDHAETPLLMRERRRRNFLNPVGILFVMFSIMLLLVYYVPRFSDAYEALIYVYISVFMITLVYLVVHYVREEEEEEEAAL